MHIITEVFKTIELHISTDPAFTKTHGKMVKACGGSYRSVRGHCTSRIVKIPSSGFSLIVDILAAYPKVANGTKLIGRVNRYGTDIVATFRGEATEDRVEEFLVGLAVSAAPKVLSDLEKSRGHMEAYIGRRQEKIDRLAVMIKSMEMYLQENPDSGLAKEILEGHTSELDHINEDISKWAGTEEVDARTDRLNSLLPKHEEVA